VVLATRGLILDDELNGEERQRRADRRELGRQRADSIVVDTIGVSDRQRQTKVLEKRLGENAIRLEIFARLPGARAVCTCTGDKQ
jgi:hypothetical protein